MIVIRYREDPTAAIITASAIVLMVASLAFMFLVEKPTSRAATKKQDDRIFKARLERQTSEQQLALSEAYIGSHTWAGNVEDISPAALAMVTSRANARGLRLLSFRPQRTTDGADVAQLPFQATVEGTYPTVMEFIRDLETEANRLVVSSIMISSTDASSDRVTASIGLSAFITKMQNSATTITPQNSGNAPTSEPKTKEGAKTNA
jgi:Tfp pilus assembly protein PilO